MDRSEAQRLLVRAAVAAGVRDARVLEVLERVPRDWFVPDEQRAHVGADVPLRLRNGQTTSQPSLIARILEELDIQPGTRVLEVGTGYGYEAALAAMLAGPSGLVVTIERDEQLVEEARRRLARLRELEPDEPPNLSIRHGDGSFGAPDRAPYDVIIVAATAEVVPRPLAVQLAASGRMLIPIDTGSGAQLTRVERHGTHVVAVGSIGAVRYVPLREGTTSGRPFIGRSSRNVLH
jgi:protein-L-isoaspartate(D-aspartate) O-methyltransferase